MTAVSLSTAALADEVNPDETLQRRELVVSLSDQSLWEDIEARPPGPIRSQFLSDALRVGILAMRTARGRLDAQELEDTGTRILSEIRDVLTVKSHEMTNQMAEFLRAYIDPENGSFAKRLNDLTDEEGAFFRRLRDFVETEDSVLGKTLENHVGKDSEFFSLLDPTGEKGLRGQMAKMIESALLDQRETLLKEFSLDSKDSALSRLVQEIKNKNLVLQEGVTGQLEKVSKEFSLDKPDSALSRLVGRVENTQKNISKEFSLDEENSAFSRLAKMIDALKKDLNESVAVLDTRRKEARTTTTHGHIFEDVVGEKISSWAQEKGDLYFACGTSTGNISHCKVGDAVLEMGVEHIASGAKIVWEVKADGKYDARKALAELEVARKNRDAQVGVFVFQTGKAPVHMEKLQRFGNDIIVLWSEEEPDSFLAAAYTLSRALLVRTGKKTESITKHVANVETSLRAIEKQVRYVDEMRKMGETTKRSGEKIASRATLMMTDLTKQIARIDEEIASIRHDD